MKKPLGFEGLMKFKYVGEQYAFKTMQKMLVTQLTLNNHTGSKEDTTHTSVRKNRNSF